MARIGRGIAQAAAALSETGLARAAEAIRTTDTFAKLAHTRVVLGGRRVTLAGIAKGSGMIEPNMGTLLAFLLTDAAASPAFLRGALRRAADASFNRVTVDGETSTSDTLLLFASGAAGNARAAQPERARRARLRGGARGGGDLARARRGARRRGGDAAGDGRRARGAQPGRGRARGAPDRQLAAREDRALRRRTRTGAASSRRSGRGACASPSSARR